MFENLARMAKISIECDVNDESASIFPPSKTVFWLAGLHVFVNTRTPGLGATPITPEVVILTTWLIRLRFCYFFAGI